MVKYVRESKAFLDCRPFNAGNFAEAIFYLELTSGKFNHPFAQVKPEKRYDLDTLYEVYEEKYVNHVILNTLQQMGRTPTVNYTRRYAIASDIKSIILPIWRRIKNAKGAA